jgi:hypothetical protein
VRRSPLSWGSLRPRCITGGASTGGIDTDAAKELKELREQNARLKRLLADAEPEKDALREIARGNF